MIGCVYPFYFYIEGHEKRLLVCMVQRALMAAMVYGPSGCVGEWTISDSRSAPGNPESASKVVLLSSVFSCENEPSLSCAAGGDERGFKGEKILLSRGRHRSFLTAMAMYYP